MSCRHCSFVQTQWRDLSLVRGSMRLPVGFTRLGINQSLCADSATNLRKRMLLRLSSHFRPSPALKGTSPKPLNKLEQEIVAMKTRVNGILQKTVPPSEESVLSELQLCEGYSKSIMQNDSHQIMPSKREKSPASILLSLDEQLKKNEPSPTTKLQCTPPIKQKLTEQISNLAYDIVRNPGVFITSRLLATYVRIQSILGFPETLPQVFVLYASKPIPVPGASPLQFRNSNPNKISSAIPFTLATMALNAAIKTKNLPLCMDIINTSVCTTASRRSKIFRRALFPVTGFSLAPIAAYLLASQLSNYLNTMDSLMSTQVAFVGIMAYVGFTSTIGFVAITTANDQMDRITWAVGIPLRERWLREDERALIDKVAGAWGFQEISRRGEEEGTEWQTLREWVGLRGMMLDRVELMEGME